MQIDFHISDVYHSRLPTFMWLTAFSQLISRICHPSPDVQNTLRAILVKLISAYPQHCLWMMASVFNVYFINTYIYILFFIQLTEI